jgi:hypothetical protein
MAINVWLRFSGNGLKLYQYSSLSMAKYLTGCGVVACCGSGNFAVELPNFGPVIVESLDGYEDFYFLNTRRILPAAASGMKFVDYDLGAFGGNIFDVACGVDVPTLFEGSNRQFLKWSRGRYSKSIWS